MADETLVSEVERLRAENAKLRERALTRARLRSASSVGLLVLGCGLAALSVVAIWLRVTLLDTDRYVKTVAPIAAEPAVQQAVANRLDTAINERIDFASLAREVLPERADVLAPVIQTGVQSFIRTRINEFTASPRFQVVNLVRHVCLCFRPFNSVLSTKVYLSIAKLKPKAAASCERVGFWNFVEAKNAAVE